ncbi:MAG: transposase [Nitrospira sp. SB0677_bin_15]|nr:transposase [Nitrospira sp. SB0667_bin_9]MYD30631.1 transposase [Nitrospira sp. SB0661_bin_20]MYG40913.1 transposase [Nitrospira sp. SB0677_bin_15]MYH03049.1 transposase [Nitrospira sp. SB0675_bin_23]MYJ22342.1 transposase [Nitrospira sp. SB0673_bin_12]
MSSNTNAHAKQFDRTFQERFVDYHEGLLFDDLAAFNRNLADWLRADNTVLLHQSLGCQSPGQFLIYHQPECQR